MSQNIFAWGPQVNEKEPDFNEISTEKKEEMVNIEAGWGLYGSFDTSEKKQSEPEPKKEELEDPFASMEKNISSPTDEPTNISETNTDKPTPGAEQKKDTKNVEKITGFSKEEVQEKISHSESREVNKKKALQLFYNKDTIKSIVQKTTPEAKEVEEKMEKFNSDTYQADLNDIMGNFVTNVEGESLESVYKNGGREESLRLNDGLTLAFETQVDKILEGKMNYKQETVDKHRRDMKEADPYEKLELFEKIKKEVNIQEAKWKRIDERFKKWNEQREAQNHSLEEKFWEYKQAAQKAIEEKNKQHMESLVEDWESLKQEADTAWDIFVWWDIDKIQEDLHSAIEAQA